ncbi:MAG TPA: hypothetical protein VJC18_11510, partial [bacterium]|nr:hypothetical protein [bacterium]
MKEYDAQTTATQNEIAQDETWVEERRLTLAEVESALNELQQKVYEWENHLRLAEAKLQGRRDEDERIGLDCEQFDRQVEELNENLAGNQNGLSQINEKLCLAELECESFDQSVAEQQQYLEALEESSQQLFLILEQSRNDYHQSSQQLVELATRREGLEHRTQELRLKQENDQNDLDELSGRYKKLEALLHDSQSGLSSVKQLKLSLGEKTQELFQSLSDEELQIQTEQSQLDDTKQDLLQKKSRLQSLRELEKNFEGYHAGPRQILKRKQTGEMSSVMGSVAEFIDVANQFESAVSAVLGEVMQSVVVTTQHESITCADYLKSESLGRSSFVALS